MHRSLFWLGWGGIALLANNDGVVAQTRVVATEPASVTIAYQRESEVWGRRWLVGLPPTGTVKLQLLEVLPEGAPQPRLGQVGVLRRQRVVEVELPAQCQRALLKVVFDTGERQAEGVGEGGWAEELYRQTVINWRQARKWRLAPGPRAKKSIAAPLVQWRVKVRQEGLYRIEAADLVAAGADLRSEDIQLVYGGGRPLPVDAPVEMVWRQVPLVVEDGGDGRFEAGDYLLFYGQPAARWSYQPAKEVFRFEQNLYTEENCYFLRLDPSRPALRAARQQGGLSGKEAAPISTYQERLHVEDENRILVRAEGMVDSGYQWYWEEFRGNARNYPVDLRDLAEGPLQIELGFWGWTEGAHTFLLRWNDRDIGQISFAGPTYQVLSAAIEAELAEGLNHLGLVHVAGGVTRFDAFNMVYQRRLVARDGHLVFDAPLGQEPGHFRLSGFGQEKPRVFAVGEGLAEVVGFAWAEGGLVFRDSLRALPQRYIAAVASQFKRPQSIEAISGGDPRAVSGAEYVVVTPREFSAAARRLAAWRTQGQGLSAAVVEIETIYDQFSGGLVDPAALRNFLAWALQHWDPAPLFVLLLGDGTYDYKNNSNTSGGNWIPPFEDGDSTYDEWYVRVLGRDVFPDMAIGRIPVQTLAAAQIVVQKLIDYQRKPAYGPWRNRALLVADDVHHPRFPNRSERYFLDDAERLAGSGLPGEIDLVKHYLANFPLRGLTKPEAAEEFIGLFNQGALVFSYLGHGNRDVLAHEQMFVLSRDLGQIDNDRRLPFAYAAASQVGPFDDPARQAMPEVLLGLEGRGVIGMIAATRIGYHASNVALAHLFHRQLYRSGRHQVPVGLALMEAKQMVVVDLSGPYGRRNVQRYSLFGDPAMALALPPYRVEITLADSLKALEEVEVRGRVIDRSGAFVADYNGQVWLQVFDSAAPTRADGLLYQQIGAVLVRGVWPVEGGRFSALFRLPKDITYRGGAGRASAYVWSSEHPDGAGAVDGIVLAGTAAEIPTDEEGPQIHLSFVGHGGFSSGAFVGAAPRLQALLADDSGLNMTGETGHAIRMTLDGEVSFVTDSLAVRGGDYRLAELTVQLPKLSFGEHRIALKAWDVFNNPAEVAAVFVVGKGNGLELSEVLFYPNPMDAAGHFSFVLSAAADQVDIRVFSLAGTLVDRLAAGRLALGYNQVAWRPRQSLAAGAYIYRIEAHSPAGGRVVNTQVLQVQR